MNPLINFLKKSFQIRYMIKNMVVRDIQSRYAGSFLGILWSFLNPVALIATYYFVFSVVLEIRLGEQYGDANFTIWLISGLLPWILFSEVISRSTNVVIANANLITKTKFPSEILPLVTLISSIINHAILVCFLLFIGFLLSIVKFSWSIVLIIPYVFLLSLFSLGISWAISSINVYLRDVEQIISISLNLWFYFTPIIYPISSVPKEYASILKCNPIYFFAEGYRAALLGNTTILTFDGFLYIAIISLIFLGIGGYIFRRLKIGFADVL